MRARGVRPRQGCVMVFPHGETVPCPVLTWPLAEGALLHEGSGSGRLWYYALDRPCLVLTRAMLLPGVVAGAKYVVRTDVLYRPKPQA
eukprot:2456241-Rhodomonas_salina.2